MIINEIIYISKGQAATVDDIITLNLKFADREGRIIGSKMISGHSPELNGTVFPIDPIDVDRVWIDALDLDYEGHTVKLNNYEYTIPMAPTVTASYKIEPIGAPTVTPVEMPEAEMFRKVMGLPMPGEPVALAKPAVGIGAGAGIAIVAIIALLALGGRKKK